ncbi:MAG: hypothetical protein GXO48_04210 [Chlorobi bacterium]|nr:hypothetical protein [Chlorobiota bacterium]
MDTPETTVELLRNADLFRMFSLIFDYPTDEVVSAWRGLAEEMLSSGLLSAYLKNEITSLLEKSSDLDELQKEYSEIFFTGKVPMCETAAHPEYDVYYNLASLYKMFGFEPRSGEAPDHITRELEFLSILCIKQLSADTDHKKNITQKAYNAFIKNNLADFTQKFHNKIKQVKPDGFYHHASKLLYNVLSNAMTHLKI